MAIVHALLQTFMFLGNGNVVHLDRNYFLCNHQILVQPKVAEVL